MNPVLPSLIFLIKEIQRILDNTREIKLDEESKKIIQDYLIENEIVDKNEIDHNIVDMRVFKDNENNYYFFIMKKYGDAKYGKYEKISITIHKKPYKQIPDKVLVLLIFLSKKQNQEISKEITKGIENIW